MAWTGPAGAYYGPTGAPVFSDPIQGNGCPNCAFVAGMSALAWVNPGFLAGVIQSANNAVTFNWAGKTQPWGFGPNIWNPAAQFCHSAAGVLWPFYYEKAFASCSLGTHGDPDGAQYPQQFAHGANINDLNKFAPVAWTNFAGYAGNFYDFLVANNLVSGSSVYPGVYAPLTGSSRQVKYPLIVGDQNAAHMYTVLGTYSNAAGTSTYILLRDPAAVGAPGGGLLADPAWMVNYAPYAGGASQRAFSWTRINLGSGIFGINKNDFGNYFTQFSKLPL